MDRFKQTPVFSTAIIVFMFISLAVMPMFAQQLNLPRASQRAEVMQRIGITDVKIVYHSPGVKEREIWGKIVPYGQVWRSGANENTTIEFSNDVKINGKELKAGTYGLLTQMGKEKDAEKVMEQAVAVADQEWMLNFYGYQLLGKEQTDKAIKVFKMNVEKYPESWNVYDSLAEALTKKGDKRGAKKNYEMAMKLIPATDTGNKERIQSIMASL